MGGTQKGYLFPGGTLRGGEERKERMNIGRKMRMTKRRKRRRGAWRTMSRREPENRPYDTAQGGTVAVLEGRGASGDAPKRATKNMRENQHGRAEPVAADSASSCQERTTL